MTGSKTLAELEHELLAATEALKEAGKATASAHQKEVFALNKVNDLQEQIDARLIELRKAAPACTDWKNQWVASK